MTFLQDLSGELSCSLSHHCRWYVDDEVFDSHLALCDRVCLGIGTVSIKACKLISCECLLLRRHGKGGSRDGIIRPLTTRFKSVVASTAFGYDM